MVGSVWSFHQVDMAVPGSVRSASNASHSAVSRATASGWWCQRAHHRKPLLPPILRA